MTTATVRATMLDGNVIEATGVFRALADKVAWERHFGVSFLAFQNAVGKSQEKDEGGNATGRIRDDADLSLLSQDKEAFLHWRLLMRQGAFTGSFDEFLANVEEIDVVFSEDDSVDPTAPDRPTGSSLPLPSNQG